MAKIFDISPPSPSPQLLDNISFGRRISNDIVSSIDPASGIGWSPVPIMVLSWLESIYLNTHSKSSLLGIF
jgi:hypothetical protein